MYTGPEGEEAQGGGGIDEFYLENFIPAGWQMVDILFSRENCPQSGWKVGPC